MFRIFMALFVFGITFVHGGMAEAANGIISGRVSASQKGVTNFRGVRVYIPGTSHIAFTDDSGNFLINNVPPGTHELFAGHVNTTDYLGTLGEARLQGVVVQPGRTTTINPVLVPVIPKLLKVEPRVIDRDTPIRIQGEKFGKERSHYPCEQIWGAGDILGGDSVRFEYDYRGWRHQVTWTCRDCMETDHGSAQPIRISDQASSPFAVEKPAQ